MNSRRNFLKWTGAALAGAALARNGVRSASAQLPTGPDVWIGRVAWPWGVYIHSRPRPEGNKLRTLYPEDLVQLRREVVGYGFMPHNHVWYETDEGYIYSSHVVPCRNYPQTPLTSVSVEGVWGEVLVPYVEGRAQPNPEAKSLYRLYYSAVYKVAEVLQVNGEPWYRVGTEVTPNMYAPASAFRIIAPEEITPISPTVSDKSVVVDLSKQTITAVEGKAEVFRAKIASGAQFFGEDGKTLTGGTGLGQRFIWHKRITRQMQGGTLEAGYDLPGVSWVSYFSSIGEAFHTAYWHNDFGRPKSRGCINMRPEDSKWFFRWTLPEVVYNPGEIIVNWDNRGTLVDIRVEA